MKKVLNTFEIIIWASIIGIALWWLSNNFFSFHLEDKIHSVTFNDIDGLEIGAPVHFMGVTIGSIASCEYEENTVKVNFVLNDSSIKIPEGSTVTIQFTGLVGSKSLEIEPPVGKHKSDKKLIVVNPIRISNFIEISANTAESILMGSRNFLKVFGDGTIIKVKQNIHDIDEITHETVEGTEKSILIVSNFRKDFLNALDRLNNSLDNYMITTDRIVHSMNARDYDEQTKAIMRAGKYTLFYFYQSLKESNYKMFLEDLIYIGNSFNRRIDKRSISFFVNLNIDNFINKVGKFNTKLETFGNFCDRWSAKINKEKVDKFFKNMLKTTNKIKEVSSKLEKRI